MHSNTLFYHSKKDPDFKQHKDHFKLKQWRSFIEKDNTAYVVEKTPLGIGSYSVVRRVVSQDMVVKEMKPKSNYEKKLMRKEKEIAELVFPYCFFQATEKDGIFRMGIPLYKGDSIYIFTNRSLSFNILCTVTIMVFDAVKLFQESNLEKLKKFIIHGDMNFHNILVEGTKEGHPVAIRLIDVGLARKENEISSGIWKKNTYLAPELELFTEVAVTQDLFSLGPLVWPLYPRQYSLFCNKNLPAFLINGIHFIQNQLTYYDPSLRMSIDKVKQFFVELRAFEGLLIGLNNKEEKEIENQVQAIIHKKEVNVQKIIPFLIHAEFDDETIALFKQYVDIDDKEIVNERKKITDATVLYVSQWILYYAKKDDLQMLEHLCMQFGKDIIKKALESKANNYVLIEEILIAKADFFLLLIEWANPIISPETLQKALLMLHHYNNIEKLHSPMFEQFQRLRSREAAKEIEKKLYPKLKKTDDCKAHLDSFNQNGSTLAHLAAIAGDLDLLKKLVERKATLLSAEDVYGCTPLHVAAMNGRTHILEKWLDSPVMYHLENQEETLAHLAARSGKTNVLKLLLNIIPNLLKVRNKKGNTVAHIAAEKGHCEILKLFSKNEILTLPNNMGYSPLHVAITEKKIEAVRFLIEEKSNLDRYDYKQGYNAIHLATSVDQIEIIDELIAIDKSLMDTESLRAEKVIEIAIKHGSMKAFKRFIKDYSDRDSLVHNIIESNQPDMLNILCEYKVDLNSSLSSLRLTPLQNAIVLGKDGMVQTLLEQKVDPNYSDDKRSALDYAVEKSNFKIMDLLLEAGAKTDVYFQSDQVTPAIAFIMLKKLQMYMNKMSDDDEAIPLSVRQKLNLIDLKNDSKDWVKCLEQILMPPPPKSTLLDFFSSQQQLPVTSQFDFSSIAGIKEFLLPKKNIETSTENNKCNIM